MKRKDIIAEVENLLSAPEYGFSKTNRSLDLPDCIDLQMSKSGVSFYFAIMALSKGKNQNQYFGSTNSTEWEFVMSHWDVFYFVLFKKDVPANNPEKILLFSPKAVLPYSSLTSLKINFNYPSKKHTRKHMDYNSIKKILESYKMIKDTMQ